ncbi:M48 family metalloprotease [Dysgonomonas sp. 511]|uniref:M48 family metalloprotease n=1 Tax=Dysgonomonas sp. 511 TaxID=2302930 RepID=UPI0013D12E61|nr:M48 family metallopeptidase [Dysgonomonas sp. 511]NDV79283.1 hypothetical protein [Dysgonomonas sp. 511]
MEIQVSATFKRNTVKAILSIVLFAVVYLILLALSVGLAVFCIIGAVTIIAAKPAVITILVGAALIGLGAIILIFLVKFFFKSNKVDRSDLTEITREEEPELFRFIEEIAQEVGTSFPKRIYLMPHVNAGVFYDSSFWSMFFPVKKNLQIGMGLVNTTTREELKAILAHEFGHFSQRSMAVGSYVYNINEAIYNMLYDNDNFSQWINNWANIANILAISTIVAVKIIQGIQWILRKMYDLININYMALSRDMEFYADEVAANVTGTVPMKESLLRLNLSDYSYNTVIDFYNDKIRQNFKSRNIFREQSFVLGFTAAKSQMTVKNGLPLVSIADLNKYNHSKLNIKDQWASHPSSEDRIEALDRLNIAKSVEKDLPAGSLFSDIKKCEEELTDKLFSLVQFKEAPSVIELEDFEKEYTEKYNKNDFSEIYNGYYNSKEPAIIDIENLEDIDASLSPDELFSKEKVNMIYESLSLENDKYTLSEIAAKRYPVKSFDYDGIKYSARKASKLIPRLETELEDIKAKIKENDDNIFIYFNNLAKKQGVQSHYKNLYTQSLAVFSQFDKKREIHTDICDALGFLQLSLEPEEIMRKLNHVVVLERKLKNEIRLYLDMEDMRSEIDQPMREMLEAYTSKDLTYFNRTTYIETNLTTLFDSIDAYYYLFTREYFLAQKRLLDYQANLYESSL